MMPSDPRRLTNLRLGVSISVPSGIPGCEDPQFVVNETTFRLGSFLLSEGAALALGQNWRPDGILEHLCHRALASRWAPLGSTAGQPSAPRILNLLAWPYRPPEADRAAQRLIREGILEIRQVRPPGFSDQFLESAVSPDALRDLLATPAGLLARIRAHTAMRQELVAVSDAQFCQGGAVGKSDRRLPGVIEEAILTFLEGKPLYISSALGGAGKAMSDVILQRRITGEAEESFFSSPAAVEAMTSLAGDYPTPVPLSPEACSAPSVRTGWNALEFFRTSVGLDKLAIQSGLTVDEYINLLTTPDPNRALGWLIAGMERLHKRQVAD